MILAGDIGATNTRLALFETDGTFKKTGEAKFSSRQFPSLLPIIQKMVRQYPDVKISSAVFGVAGPVQNGRCQTTNLPWTIDRQELENELRISPVFLLNDLEATAWGIDVLEKKDICLIHPGKMKEGNRALLVAGTGLGEAGLYWDGSRHHPFACEGGHTDFGPRNDLEIGLLQYLRKTYGHVSYERIVSGPGLVCLYRFLVESGIEKPSLEVEQEMRQKDPAQVITDWGLQQRDPVCTKAIEWFVSLYGAEAGNLALKVFALGGVYIGGNIAKKLKDLIQRGGWVRAFTEKGRFQPLLNSMSVSLVLNEDAPLLGAVKFALSH